MTRKEDKRIRTFLAVSGLGILLTLLYQILSGNGTGVFDVLVLGESDNWELADFFRHIGFAADLQKTYSVSVDACFPPLAYLFFHLLYRMNLAAFSGLDADDWQGFVQTPYAILFYVMFVAVFAVLLFALVLRITGVNEAHALTAVLCLLVSFPFFTALERGNPVLITVLLLLAATVCMDAPDARVREAALILIAVAIGFKLYPAIMVLLYVKKKRFAEAIRLVVYAAVLFFVPFVFFGGMNGFLQFMDVLLHGHYNADFMREWSSVRGVTYVLGARVGLTDAACARAGQVLENLFLLLSVLGMWRAKKKWTELFFLSAVMCFYMPTSWVYNTVYLSIGLLWFLREGAERRLDTITAVLFGLIFTLPAWCLMWNPGTWVCIMAYLMWGMLFVSVVKRA